MYVDTARAAADLFMPLFEGAAAEKLAVAHLGAGRSLIALRERPALLEAEVELPIADILREAVTLGSCALIIAHNHPSGDPAPSRADIRATRELAAGARAVGILVHDHLIFARGNIASFRGLGLL